MTRVALLTEVQEYDPKRSWNEQLISVGGNSGNNAYVAALQDIFRANRIDYNQLDLALQNDEYDVYIVGNLSWIVENTSTPDFYYSSFRKIVNKGKKFVPISVGTQVYDYKPDFKYHPQVLNFFKEISDQAIIACRGEYTAELLYKNGVKNIEVIGCPSLFHPQDPNFKISKPTSLRKKPKIATGLTPWENEKMSSKDIKKFIQYAFENNIDFIEQADTDWIDILTASDNQFKRMLERYFNERFKMFFNIDEWRNYAKTLDFSFGGRFHGNVIPLLEGVPALFISIDSRTREMCEYFRFPTIDIKQFRYNYTIDELYELADYTEFNKRYRYLYDRFQEFSYKNNLLIANSYNLRS